VLKQGYYFVFLMRKAYTKSNFVEHEFTKAQDVKRQMFIKLSDPHKVEDTRMKLTLTSN
jgi:ribosomal protein S6